MSARTPFMPFSGQSKLKKSSNLTDSGPAFIPSSRNTALRGSGQANSETENTSLGLDLNQPLPLAGLLGRAPNRTASHGTGAAKNLLQMATAATINRPQTAGPGHGNRGDGAGTSLNNKTNTDNKFEGILSPAPIKIAHQKPSVLISPTFGSFKTPALPSQVDPGPPEHSLDLFSAHIPSDLRSHRRSMGAPTRQQPTPDPSDQSGSTDEHLHSMNVSSGLFRDSLPSDPGHGHDTNEIRARRVFQHDYDHNEQIGYYDRASLSNNRRHPRDRHVNEDDQAQPPSKRQRSSFESPSRGNTGRSAPVDGEDMIDESNFQQCQKRPNADVPAHSCILGQIMNHDVDQFLQDRVEHFNNRVHSWENASNEEWEDGAKVLNQKFSNMLNKTQRYMKRKQELFTMLESRITEHQGYLRDREQALTVAKQNFVNDSQSAIGGRFTE